MSAFPRRALKESFGRLPQVPAWFIAALTAIFITFASNQTLLDKLLERADLHSAGGLLTAMAIPSLITTITFALLLMFGLGRFLKPLAVSYLLVASILGFFIDHYGVIFDEGMIRNLVDTVVERNVHEATELVSVPFLLHVLLYGLLPAAAVLVLDVREQKPVRELKERLVAVSIAIALIAATLMASSRLLITFGAENRDLRHYINPLYAIASAEKFFRHERAANAQEFYEIGQDAHVRETHARRTLGVLIVGETARADHFSLNGYGRETNPLLAQDAVVSFTDAHSCGTATAVSVPCLFSLRKRVDFDAETIRHESNVLDILQRANVDVIWLDGNSGCKFVCARVKHESVSPVSTDGTEPDYFDAMLVDSLTAHIDSLPGDSLIVLHMLGSHGPAYGQRVPPDFQVFQPTCSGNSPISCDRSQLINAYDNTIVYTDFVIHRVIEELQRRSGSLDTFVLYVSDHGESLGEGGVFLHGLPYAIAPEAQKHIAIIFWGSEDFLAHHGLTTQIRSSMSHEPLSHDNVSHVLLGLFDVASETYDPRMDPFAARSSGDNAEQTAD